MDVVEESLANFSDLENPQTAQLYFLISILANGILVNSSNILKYSHSYKHALSKKYGLVQNA